MPVDRFDPGERPRPVADPYDEIAGAQAGRTDQGGGHPDVAGRGTAALHAEKSGFLPSVHRLQDPGSRDDG
ncbi:hypothetical protein Sliba_76640 [Streptomyces nigrescens]|uniref:Uncharacterized protein n=1 Tax=Streptomyces nigrescens TaxID=1920 RepID=A0A640TYC2_STRNI|nr:hypothetical protein Sliba_76640 [Streptomyces libani subsp. libani]GGV96762.1 hypothetical protein GCM10010500_40430 [Streptomyces libani subsp. libani]